VSRFTARPLGALENIYRFVGGQTGPNVFTLAAPLQPVHDVSREAEMGTAQTGALGYFYLGTVDAHVGVGNIFTTSDPYAGPFRDLDPVDVDVWIIDALCTCDDSADFDIALLGLIYPILPGAFATAETQLLFEFTTPARAIVSAGDSTIPAVIHRIAMPTYVPHGATLAQRTSADVAGTNNISLFTIFWAGARGILPPGMP